MEKNGKTYIHLLNTSGEHRAARVKAFDEILPIYNVSIMYKVDKMPSQVTLLSENKALSYTYEAGMLKVQVEKIEIHSAIEIVFKKIIEQGNIKRTSFSVFFLRELSMLL